MGGLTSRIASTAAILLALASGAPLGQAQSLMPITTEQYGVAEGEVQTTPRAAPSIPTTTTATEPEQRGSRLVFPEQETLRPFGAALFDRPGMAGGEGPNPNYMVSIGDQIAVKMWGSVEADVMATVDPQGNIFIPQVGPIAVAGVRSGTLSEHVDRHVRSVVRNSIRVYATLVRWRAIGVFVTGFVERPGRYPGAPSESLIDFLAKAGGIDPERGSYRDVAVLRNGEAIARVDLYRFLLEGVLPPLQFSEGDTIVVAAQRPTVAASGKVRNSYRFEFPRSGGLSGQDLMALARPLPAVTHARLQGTREDAPVTEYQELAAFRTAVLRDRDQVSFDQDAPERYLTVEVSGANLGPSVFVADPTSTLMQLLSHVKVDPRRADVTAVHIRRESVAHQQKLSLQAALDRLERSLFTADVATEGEARIRRAEAEMVSKYIQRARSIVPDGTVVVVNEGGEVVDLPLEDKDEVVVPERRSVVVVSGEVLVPQALVFQDGYSAAFYISRAGGFTDRSDENKVVIRRLNGQVHVVDPSTQVRAGDEVIVMPEIKLKTFQFAKDLIQILFQIAVISKVALDL